MLHRVTWESEHPLTAEQTSVREGAAARLEALYPKMLPVVFGYARGRLPEADAEDVTAEVFRAALQVLMADSEAELRTSWFLTAAHNRIIDRWRRDLRWEGRIASLQHEVRQRSHAALGEESSDRVLDALDAMSPEHRAVLVLRYVDGFSAKEVAAMTGRSARAVDSLLARARSSFATAYEKDGS